MDKLSQLLTALSGVLTLLVALVSLWSKRLKRDNVRLRARLIVALSDNLAFINVENEWCRRAGHGHELAAKREMRRIVRDKGLDTPSEKASLVHVEHERNRLIRNLPL